MKELWKKLHHMHTAQIWDQHEPRTNFENIHLFLYAGFIVY